MNRILIVNQSAGYLTVDVVNSFLDYYEEVILFTGEIRHSDRPISPKVKIVESIRYNRSSTIKRIASWLIFSVHVMFSLLIRFRGYTILYYSNPPIVYFNSLFFSNPFGLVIFDVYPDALKLMRISQESLLFNLWVSINKIVFKKSKKIITIGEGMRNQLSQYIDKKSIDIVPIWSSSEKLKPIPKSENEFLLKHNLVDDFIILYSGNMGLGHRLEVLIDMAEKLKTNSKTKFILIGEGAKKSKLIKMVEERGLSNVIFFSWQPVDNLTYTLAAADISIVALETEVSNSSVPSKTFNYLAVGSPILGICHEESDLSRLIGRYNVGRVIHVDDLGNGLDFIAELSSSKETLNKYSKFALEASKEFSHNQSKQYVF